MRVKTRLLPRLERKNERVIPTAQFAVRLARSGTVAFGLVVVSLFIGMVGYHTLEHLDWIDAFLNAAMILGGMGPVNTVISTGGKIFAGSYALYSGLVILIVAGVILTPIVHRTLHKFHADSPDK